MHTAGTHNDRHADTSTSREIARVTWTRGVLTAVAVIAAAWLASAGDWRVVLAAATVALLAVVRGRELRLLYAMVAPLWGHRIFLQTLLRISRTGDAMTPIVQLRLWPLARTPVLIVNDTAIAREILHAGAAFATMGQDNPATVALLGDRGLFTTNTTDSPEWQRRRRVTDRLLSSAPAFTERMFADLLATSRTYVADWRGHQGGLLQALAQLLIPAQSLALYGEPFTPAVHRQAGADLLANFQGIGEGLLSGLTETLRRPWTRERLGRSWAYIQKIADVIVADARQPAPDDARPGMFRLLSDAYRDGTYDAAEVRDTVALFLNAGAPLHMVFWTLHSLAHHQDVQARVVDELQRALAAGPLTFARLHELSYLRSVLFEVMRLYPPVPLFQPRRAVHPAQIGDIAAPAGTQILISPFVFQRNPAIGADVEAFRPGRADNGYASPHMFPFSVGPRTCQGRNFAMLAVTAALVSILERHEVHLHERGPCPHPSEAVYCRPSHDVSFSVSPRAPADRSEPREAAPPARRCPFAAMFKN